MTFAHTYNGYDLHGGSAGLAEVVLPVHERWERTGDLPGDVDVLRACLFFQQRSHYWDGGLWDFDTAPSSSPSSPGSARCPAAPCPCAPRSRPRGSTCPRALHPRSMLVST